MAPSAGAAEPRAAATALLLRDGGDGIEVFLVQRHRRSGFLPSAWVFPGGRVDPEDRALALHPRVRGGAPLAAAFGLAREEAAAHGIAAVRETFEEAGVWLGDGVVDGSLRDELHSGRLSLASILERPAGGLDLDRMFAWSWWVTPAAEPRRYDTRFVVVHADAAEGRHDDLETVDSRWIAPSRALAAGQAAFPLAPPTWWTLRELARHGTVADALASARPAHRPIEPVLGFDPGGLVLLMPGHPEHPAPAVEGLPDRITWVRDGWVAWHGDVPVSDGPSDR